MRRPAVVFPFFFGAGIFLAYQLNMELVSWCILATFTDVACIWLLIRKFPKKMVSVWICMCFFFAGGCLLLISDIKFTAASSTDTDRAYEEGIVLDVEQKDGYCLVLAKNRNKKILLKSYGNVDVSEGVWIQAFGEKEMPAGRRNPGCRCPSAGPLRSGSCARS